MSNLDEERRQAQGLRQQLGEMVRPLLRELDKSLDKRLVVTFFLALQALVMNRHSRNGLLLSELGGYILSPAHAPAGTKRLSNLLRSKRWKAAVIEQFLWRQATARVKELRDGGHRALVLWDESEWEKPESVKLEGLCAVRSSKAARLKRMKPGFTRPPKGPAVFVPGMHWLSVVVTGMKGTPAVARQRWWTTRGPQASTRAQVLKETFLDCVAAWQQQVIHVFDRGFAVHDWMDVLLSQPALFVVRWNGRFLLQDGHSKRPAWQITRGKRSLDHRLVLDARRRCWRRTGIVFVPVLHPDHPDVPLTLVVSRPGSGRPPWYLLTNLPIQSVDDAWSVILIYARRWQIETTYRFAKTELAVESPRLWAWDNRLKLLAMLSLVNAFLLSLLHPDQRELTNTLLQRFCPRTGKRHREAAVPLYRLRLALSQLWSSVPDPIPVPLSLNPG